jgi:hypothetical protein
LACSEQGKQLNEVPAFVADSAPYTLAPGQETQSTPPNSSLCNVAPHGISETMTGVSLRGDSAHAWYTCDQLSWVSISGPSINPRTSKVGGDLSEGYNIMARAHGGSCLVCLSIPLLPLCCSLHQTCLTRPTTMASRKRSTKAPLEGPLSLRST